MNHLTGATGGKPRDIDLTAKQHQDENEIIAAIDDLTERVERLTLMLANLALTATNIEVGRA